MSDRRLTSAAIRARKNAPFPVMTAYDAPFGRCVEEAGIDVILVGDSLGMVVLGFASTANVELDDMLRHVGAVARGTHRAHVIGDLPFGAYEANDKTAVRSSIALVKAGADSVKLEGGIRMAPRIHAIVCGGVPVVGHIGVTPPTAATAPKSRQGSPSRRSASAAGRNATRKFSFYTTRSDSIRSLHPLPNASPTLPARASRACGATPPRFAKKSIPRRNKCRGKSSR